MTSLFPSSVYVSTLVVGETTKSYKISTIFVGNFADGQKLATRTSSSKYTLVEKTMFDFVYKSRVDGKTTKGFPNIHDDLLGKDSCPLYARDWNQMETWRVI